MIDKICETCGKPYQCRPYMVDRAKYCSRECSNISKMLKVDRVCEICGMTYTTVPSKNLRYCSSSCYHTTINGSGNPNYKGGFAELRNPRNSFEYADWRTAVFLKDDFTCRCCGRHGGTLNAHHLLSYSRHPKHALVVENGVTLCESCHKEFHHLYGVRRFTDKDYWEWLESTVSPDQQGI